MRQNHCYGDFNRIKVIKRFCAGSNPALSTQQQIFDILRSHGKGGDNSPTGRAKIYALSSTERECWSGAITTLLKCERDSGKSAM